MIKWSSRVVLKAPLPVSSHLIVTTTCEGSLGLSLSVYYPYFLAEETVTLKELSVFPSITTSTANLWGTSVQVFWPVLGSSPSAKPDFLSCLKGNPTGIYSPSVFTPHMSTLTFLLHQGGLWTFIVITPLHTPSVPSFLSPSKTSPRVTSNFLPTWHLWSCL